MDLAFIAYDVIQIQQEGWTLVNTVALCADVAAALIPVGTGGGPAVRAAMAGGDAALTLTRTAVKVPTTVRAGQAGEKLLQLIDGGTNSDPELSASNARTNTSNSSSSINFNPGNIQHAFSKHASDFGIAGNWNSLNGKAFQQAILDHIKNQVTQVIHGTYRGSISGTHHYNPESGLWVFVDHQGNFIAGWKLSPEQLEYLQLTGNIQ